MTPGNLYYGGGLQNLLKLIGEYRKRKFLKTIVEGNNLNDKQKWEAMVRFLEDEHTERDMSVINETTGKCTNLEG